MDIGTVMVLLMVISALVGLVTEAVKKILDDTGKTCPANILAGCVSLVLSVAVGAGYTVLTETHINAQIAVYLIALVFLSWLSSMVGYDKVKQTVLQLKGE